MWGLSTALVEVSQLLQAQAVAGRRLCQLQPT